ncbi:MAG: VOC family protein [Pseudomonadota bacterium]
MSILSTRGVHHITLNGADRQTSIDFWEGVLGMPFVFEQPNLDDPDLNHLYFDPGDGRLITIFTSEKRTKGDHKSADAPGAVHHLAFDVDAEMLAAAAARLRDAGYGVAERDRGFMNSLYFREPLGHLIELASYKIDPPDGVDMPEVLKEAYRLRQERGAAAIESEDLLAAAKALSA